MLTPTTVALVAIGALVVFGPKKLPELARSLGKSLAEFKAGAADAQETFRREFDSKPESAPPATPPTAAAPSEPKDQPHT
jgi:TatA/E family protein of Tat protein translocase